MPLDGSDHSTRAFQEAIKLAKLVDGKITLIHVFSAGASFVASARQDYLYQIAHRNGKNILANGEKEAKANGVKVETLLFEGDTVKQIVEVAYEGDFNLVVIGARGVSKIKGLFLGSVSAGVIRHSACPVLIVK